MGWASGSELAIRIIESVRQVEDTYERYRIYGDIIDSFEAHDCDTLDECCGVDPMFDNAYRDRHGEVRDG